MTTQQTYAPHAVRGNVAHGVCDVTFVTRPFVISPTTYFCGMRSSHGSDEKCARRAYSSRPLHSRGSAAVRSHRQACSAAARPRKGPQRGRRPSQRSRDTLGGQECPPSPEKNRRIRARSHVRAPGIPRSEHRVHQRIMVPRPPPALASALPRQLSRCCNSKSSVG